MKTASNAEKLDNRPDFERTEAMIRFLDWAQRETEEMGARKTSRMLHECVEMLRKEKTF